MKLHELRPAKGSKHSRRRVGRGPGSGNGVTAGRGEKGQKSRAGYSSRPGFEGGQMPLVRRVPKRGFTNIFKQQFDVVNVGQLADHAGELDPETLARLGLVTGKRPVKILGNGTLMQAIKLKAHKFSQAARDKIEAVGGRCEELAW